MEAGRPHLVPPFVQARFQEGTWTGEFNAAVLFVDIPGFTRLTEQLWQEAHDGAEKLSEALRAVFSPMIAAVGRQGGLVPLLAGDAFTAVFPIHNQAEAKQTLIRAVSTAMAFQRELSPAQQYEQTHNSAIQAVKIGISYGRVAWGIVGEDGQHAYYFRGEPIERAGLAQQFARAGEIVLDVTAVDRLPDVVTACQLESIASRPDFAYLVDCLLPLIEGDADWPPASQETLAPFVPASVMLLADTADFREACPLFISFSSDIDEAALHAFIRLALRLSRRYGGTFSQVDFGDKGGLLVLWFGAPVAHENSARRAAEFLLTLQKEETDVVWRAGLTFGQVWAGFRGGDERCEYGLVGDEVNLAARLALAADWGGIWVDTAVYQRLSEHYWLANLGPKTLRGKSRKTVVFQLLQRQARRDAIRQRKPASNVLIGRRQDADTLRHFVRPIFDHSHAGVMVIHGDAGSGKTRLVDAQRDDLVRSEFANWMTCPADELQQISLQPFRAMLRQYFRYYPEFDQSRNLESFDLVYDYLLTQLEKTAPTKQQLREKLTRLRSFAAALVDLYEPDSLFTELSPQLRAQNMHDAIIALLQAESVLRPTILHLENGHWFDVDSLALLPRLAAELEGHTTAIIVTSRLQDDGTRHDFGLDPDRVVHHQLRPLEKAAVRELAEQILQAPIDDRLTAFLMERTEGNTLFVEQLALTLQDEMLLQATSSDKLTLSSEAVSLPPSIKALLASRLDRLPRNVLPVVQTAAVLGVVFDVKLLAAVLVEIEDVEPLVAVAYQQQVWTPVDKDGHYRFRHALLRDVAYQMLLPVTVRRRHRRAAMALEKRYQAGKEPPFTELAYHWEQADEKETAVVWHQRAAEQAATYFANAEAVYHYNRALALLPSEALARAADLLLKLIELYHLMGEREPEEAHLEQLASLVEVLNTAQLRITLLNRQSEYAKVTGDYQKASSLSRRAINLADFQGTPQQRARANLNLGVALQFLEEIDQAEEVLSQALHLAGMVNDELLVSECSLALGKMFWLKDQFAEAKYYVQQALLLNQSMGNIAGQGLALNRLGLIHENMYDFDAAEKHFMEALQIFTGIGDRWSQSIVLGNLGYMSMRLGQYDRAEQYYQADLKLGQATSDKHGHIWTLSYLSYLSTQREAYDTAVSYAHRAQDLLARFENEWLHMINRWHLGLALLGRNELQLAQKSLVESLALAESYAQYDRHRLEIAATLADTAFRMGHLSAAREYLEPVIPFCQSSTVMRVADVSRIYLVCYQILAATADPRALPLLEKGYQMLEKQAERINDSSVRQTFLNSVPANRQLQAAWHSEQT